MPNHCDNDLFIYGSEDSIKEFIEFSKKDDELLSADKYIPYPQKYKDMDLIAEIARKNGDYHIIDGFNSGGYEWCVQNWGTKWGIYEAIIKEEKFSGKRSKVIYNFNSAWSPPLPVIKAMSVKFPELKFKLKYYEGGGGFKGTFEVQAGQVTAETNDTYRGRRGG